MGGCGRALTTFDKRKTKWFGRHFAFHFNKSETKAKNQAPPLAPPDAEKVEAVISKGAELRFLHGKIQQELRQEWEEQS